jgi:hypothetical protein
LWQEVAGFLVLSIRELFYNTLFPCHILPQRVFDKTALENPSGSLYWHLLQYVAGLLVISIREQFTYYLFSCYILQHG